MRDLKGEKALKNINASSKTMKSHNRQVARLDKAIKSGDKKAVKVARKINQAEENINAIRESKRNGGIKSISRTKNSTAYNYKNGKNYFIDK